MQMSQPMSIHRNVRDRIAAVVRQVEGQPVFRNESRYRTPVITMPVMEAIVTSTISAATISGGTITYGQGMVQIVVDKNTSGVYTSINNSSFPDPVLVLSGSTTTGGVPVGTIVGVYSYNGRFGLAWVDCGN
jgi:hypothetical protein